jgi:large subunit ribosomal protein L21
MYAVVETGGKQYRVEVGTELEVELLDVEPGQEITLERVLLVADGADATIGQPVVADAAVRAQVLRQDRGPKLISFKYRPKARRRVKKGHRQELTVLRITDVVHGGVSAAAALGVKPAAVADDRKKLEAAAAKQAAEDAAIAAKLAMAAPAAAPAEGEAEAPKKTRKAPAKAAAAEAAPAADAAAETEAAPAKRTRKPAEKKDE